MNMNNRVFELARQAGLYDFVVDRQTAGQANPTHNVYPRFLTASESHDAYQRFAKLLIADACEALKNWETKIWQSEPSRRHLFFNEDLATNLIKEHFGVKQADS